MALSKTVEDSLNDAESSLRNALSFAARHERPMVCSAISELIHRIESLKAVDGFLDKMDSRNGRNGGDGDTFFKMIFPPGP